ncbi:hypothetical protein IWW50_003692, partial [Coemansia erecta]
MDLPAEFSRVLRCKAARQTANTMYSDKVYLPPSFLTSLLDTRSRDSGQEYAHRQSTSFRRTQQYQTAPEPSSISDYAPGDSSQLPSPLIFRLMRRSGVSSAGKPSQNDRSAVFCGVREFSCDEGYVGIPEWLMRDSGLAAGDSVAVEFVRAEKGLFAQLRALDAAAKSVGDLRALLETHMRTNLTALTVGETFQVPVGGMERPLSFSVAALEPMDAVDIVDTDLSVDIVHADGGVVGSQVGDELAPGSTREVTVDEGQSQVFQLHIPAQVKSTDVVVTCGPGGDVSVCASRLMRNVSILDNTWFDYSPPSQQPKRLRIEQSELPSGSNNVYVSVVGFAASTCATIDVRFDAPREAEPAEMPGSVSEAEPDSVECTNCGSKVPAARFAMHQAVCERHNVKCERCPRVFKRGSTELEQHWHCDLCGEAGAAGDRSKHVYMRHTPRA